MREQGIFGKSTSRKRTLVRQSARRGASLEQRWLPTPDGGYEKQRRW